MDGRVSPVLARGELNLELDYEWRNSGKGHIRALLLDSFLRCQGPHYSLLNTGVNGLPSTRGTKDLQIPVPTAIAATTL